MGDYAAAKATGREAVTLQPRDAWARDNDNAGFTRDPGHALTRAMHAFGEERYADVLQLIRTVRAIANRFGGSHAQRDVIDLTLVEAAIHAGTATSRGRWRRNDWPRSQPVRWLGCMRGGRRPSKQPRLSEHSEAIMRKTAVAVVLARRNGERGSVPTSFVDRPIASIVQSAGG